MTVISPALLWPLEGIRHVARTYEPGDLAGAYLAIAAANSPEVNAAVGREARRAGILFNRSDCPEDCDFFFPAVCEGNGLVAGIVGGGSDHKKTAQAARKIREALDEL